LRNAVTVEALYDRDVARELMVRNLLQSEGYNNIEELRREGEKQGEAVGQVNALLWLLKERGLTVTKAHRTRL